MYKVQKFAFIILTIVTLTLSPLSFSMTLTPADSSPPTTRPASNVQLGALFANMQNSLNAAKAVSQNLTASERKPPIPANTAKRVLFSSTSAKTIAYKSQFPDLKVAYNETNGTAVFIKAQNLFSPPKNAKIADIPLAGLQEYRDLLKITDANSEFRQINEFTDEQGLTHVKFQQIYKSVPLSGKEILVHLDQNNSVYLIEGRIEPSPTLDVTPALTNQQALDLAKTDLGQLDDSTTCELVIFFDNLKTPHLAYEISAVCNHESWKLFIDARTGQILQKYNDSRRVSIDGSGADSFGRQCSFPVWQQGNYNALIDTTQAMHLQIPNLPNNPGKGNIAVLTCNGADPTASTNATLYFVLSGSTGWDPVAVGVYDSLRKVQDYYRTTFNRKSIDNQGLNSIGVIHCGGQSLAGNAGWFPGMNMIFFGEASGQMDSMAKALDFTAHEFTHGVTSFSANLEYMYQSGALNEAFSDIFACMVDRDDWTLGEDIVKVSPGFCRSLASPHDGLESLQAKQAGIGYEPAHMNEYRNLSSNEDNGGVHINSTIPGHAAYMIAEGLGSSSIGRAKTEQIFYRALTTHLTRQGNFSDARLATVQSAEELYGADSPEVQAVIAGWNAVGVQGTDGTGGNDSGNVAPIQGNDGIVFIYEYNGRSYLGGQQNGGTPYQISSHPIKNTRPVPTQEGIGVLFVDATNNLRLAALSPDTVYDQAVTFDGYVRTIGGSQDGRYFAFTTTDNDNKLYLLDMNDNTGNSNKVIELHLPSDNNLTVKTLKYADVIDFDLSGKRIIFDALNEVKLGNDQQPVQTWSIGVLDIQSGNIQSLVPGQTQGVHIGNPAAANTKDWLVAVDVWNDTDKTFKTQIINLNTGQTGLVAQETNPTTDFGFASFSGDDQFIAMQYQNQIIKVPVVEQSGTFTGDFANAAAILNSCYYPRYYRAGKRAVAPKISASKSSIDFGVVELNQSATQTLTITNTGTYDLTIDHLEVSNSTNFSFTGANHTALTPNASVDITVTFTATAPRQKSAILAIVTDNQTEEPLTLPLHATVPQPQTTPTTTLCGSAPLFLIFMLTFLLTPKSLITANSASITKQ